MTTATALYHALDLLDGPILAGLMRNEPLPDDVLMLIKIAAGDEAACRRAAAMTAASPARIRAAAVLYLQNVLLAPGADHYRVLGVAPDAPRATMRHHLGWLMKWLHPDRAASDWDSAFAERVIAAWDAVKTPQRRARYDRCRGHDRSRPHPPMPLRQPILRRAGSMPWIAQNDPPPRRRPGRRRALALIVVGAVAAVAALIPGSASHAPQPDGRRPAPRSAAGRPPS